jgi:hypothetical protein
LGGSNSKIFNKKKANLNAQAWKVGWPWWGLDRTWNKGIKCIDDNFVWDVRSYETETELYLC